MLPPFTLTYQEEHGWVIHDKNIVLGDKVGRGACGEVWRGTCIASDQPVAVKVVARSYAAVVGTQRFWEAFTHEAKASVPVADCLDSARHCLRPGCHHTVRNYS